jgi:pyruvate,orthophosphate dikinase
VAWAALRVRRRATRGRRPGKKFTAPGGIVVKEGDTISIDGATGEVFLGEVPVESSPVVQYFEGEIDPDAEDADPIVRSVHRLMQIADRVRHLRVRTNADTAEDAARARRFGAEGIGLCRTEHMFLGERRALVERLILAEGRGGPGRPRRVAPVAAGDFVKIFEAMDGLPVTVRLLDPPLHEFLPSLTDLSVKVALNEAKGGQRARRHPARGRAPPPRAEPDARPARGALGLVIQHLFQMQTQAIMEAAAIASPTKGAAVTAEIMVPLVGSVNELALIRREIDYGARARVARSVHFVQGRHDDRTPQSGGHGPRDRDRGRLLLLRHQRPDPDGLGLQPR